MTFYERAEQFPPLLVRILARKNNGRRAMSTSDIAKASGLPRSTVGDLTWKTSWASVTFGDMADFCKGCGFDHLHTRHNRELLLKRAKSYMHAGNAQQRKMFMGLLSKLEQWATANGN